MLFFYENEYITLLIVIIIITIQFECIIKILLDICTILLITWYLYNTINLN